MCRFIGKLDFAPQDPHNPTVWTLDAPFGFLRNDGMLIIVMCGGKTDGASIPRFLWRVFGHPFHRRNRFWAIIHDGGYGKYAIIIDLNVAELPPDYVLDNWDTLTIDSFVNGCTLSRKWWDDTLLMAMTAMGECWVKRVAVYKGVRAFGWLSYRKHRR
jgi:hypothetical protein